MKHVDDIFVESCVDGRVDEYVDDIFVESCVDGRASGEAILGTQRYPHESILNVKNFRASGEAILGTQRYSHESFLHVIFFSRLRRGHFRYTTIL